MQTEFLRVGRELLVSIFKELPGDDSDFCLQKFLCLARFLNTGKIDSLLNTWIQTTNTWNKKTIRRSDPVLHFQILMLLISLFSASYTITIWQLLSFINTLDDILFSSLFYDTHWPKSTCWKKRFDWFTGFNSSLNDTKAQSKLGIIEEWCISTALLPLIFSFTFLLKPRATCLKMELLTVVVSAFLHHLTTKKMWLIGHAWTGF